jgi:SOS-response transcriptional repressor LexA
MSLEALNTERNVARMKTWYELAKARMKELKVTQEGLAERVGVTQGAIAHWLGGRREPPLDMIQKVLKELDLPRMDVGATPEPSNVAATIQPKMSFRYPVISWVSAGAWAEAVEPFPPGFSDRYEISDYNSKGAAFWLDVKGDSMTAPTGTSVPEGMMILVDTEADVKPGKLVIAKLPSSNEATFKKLVEDGGIRYLKPLNPAYKMVECGEDCRIIGVAVRVMGKL